MALSFWTRWLGSVTLSECLQTEHFISGNCRPIRKWLFVMFRRFSTWQWSETSAHLDSRPRFLLFLLCLVIDSFRGTVKRKWNTAWTLLKLLRGARAAIRRGSHVRTHFISIFTQCKVATLKGKTLLPLIDVSSTAARVCSRRRQTAKDEWTGTARGIECDWTLQQISSACDKPTYPRRQVWRMPSPLGQKPPVDPPPWRPGAGV